MKIEIENTGKSFKKIAFFLSNKSWIILLLYILLCLLIALLLFYFFIITPKETVFNINKKTPLLNRELYNATLNRWGEDIELKANNLFNSEIEETDTTKAEKSILEKELEIDLAETLFELYEFEGNEMPTISERAKIWEDLSLGDSNNYKGSYSQNIRLLSQLKEELQKE